MAFGELLLLYWRCMYRIPLPAVYIVSYGSRLFFMIVACYLSLSPEDRKRTAAGSQLLPRTLPCSQSHPASQANTSLHHHRDPNPHVPSLVSENTAETMTLAVPPLLPTFATATSLVIGGFSATARKRRRSIRSPKARSSCREQKNSTVSHTGRRPLYRRAHASC